ncbi:MAG: hypothetical protein BWY11_00665 [Firmicutes bacterium ADurb.Bin182]|nr:MAG: hypothetical protein BWY11_00665 [Firmicutes bacterium ADurb.Bin182]
MISVLGFELKKAVDMLEKCGFTVNCVEYSSRKGVKGNEKRVIRQSFINEDQSRIELVYSLFKTDVDYKAD